eukprot:9393398-Heterocapsa_arctica.AAC.1
MRWLVSDSTIGTKLAKSIVKVYTKISMDARWSETSKSVMDSAYGTDRCLVVSDSWQEYSIM